MSSDPPEKNNTRSTGAGADEQTPLIAQPSDEDLKSSSPVDVETGGNDDNKTSAYDEDGLAEVTPAQSPYTSNEEVGGFTKGCFVFFASITTVAIIVLACMSASQIILLSKKHLPFLQFSLRLYILVFCLIFMLVELDWPPQIMRNLPTNNWLMRGWMYSFLGLVGMEEAFAVLVSDSSTSNILGSDLISIFVQISSWGMVAIGVLYFALGLLCMRSLKEKVRKDYYAAKDKHRRQQDAPNVQV
mmetsp:Transcript_5794/g.16334  ORF Transcript_5794/g.16334 Transcript_5794/m.16334 type:complete len:244 (+) Transcript_5794:185-916(+)